jgi:MFS family permease
VRAHRVKLTFRHTNRAALAAPAAAVVYVASAVDAASRRTIMTPDTPPPQHYRHNFTVSVLNGIFWNLAEAFANDNVVTAVLLSHLTPSNLLVSLLSPIRTGGWFLPQLFVAPLMARLPLKVEFYRRIIWLRVVAWALLIVSLIWIRDSALLLGAIFTSTLVIALADGLGGLPFMIVTSKTIPANKRGLLFAWRNGLGSLFGIGGGALLGLLLGGNLVFPYNFAAAYGVAAVCYFVCYTAFGLTREPREEVSAAHATLAGLIPRSKALVRGNGSYANFLASRAALLFGAAALPFITVYAKRHLGMSDGALGALVSTIVAATLAGNIVFGRLSIAISSKRMYAISLAMGAAVCIVGVLMVIAAPGIGTVLVFVACGLIGMSNAVASIALGPLTMDQARPGERDLTIGLTNTVVGVVLLVRGVIGVFVDFAGFGIFFAICAAFYLLAFERLRHVVSVMHAEAE